VTFTGLKWEHREHGETGDEEARTDGQSEKLPAWASVAVIGTGLTAPPAPSASLAPPQDH
jgi:hypothetical protein